MKLNVIAFLSDNFVYIKETKTFVAEASQMWNRHLQPLYDDSYDRGFKMESVKTGNVVTYVMVKANLDDEYEIESWTYTPTRESEQSFPGCVGTTVKVYND